MERLERESGNLRAAIPWTLGTCEEETAARFGWTLWPFWWMRGHHCEARPWIEVGVLTNLIAVPISGPILALGLLASLLGNVAPSLAYPLNACNGFLVTILTAVARFASSLPSATSTTPGVTPHLVALFYVACVPIVAAGRAFRPETRPLWVALLTLWTTLWLILVCSGTPREARGHSLHPPAHNSPPSVAAMCPTIPIVGVYLLLGDDEERKARGLEKLGRGRAAESFDASATSPQTVISALNSFDLFGEGPFVVVRNLDAWNAAQKAVVVDYLQSPTEGADLLLLGKKLGSRERLLSAAKKNGEVHDLQQPTGRALVKWLVGHAKKLGLDLPDEVAENLAERVSGDKMRLVQETEKLALYVGDGTATLRDVDLLCPPDVQSNIFAFVDALAARERGRAIELLEDLVGTGEPPLRLTFMVRRQFRLVARARALFDRGVPQPEVTRELKVPPFVARKLSEQSRKLDERDLERALATVLALESGLKGGSDLRDGLQVELAVLELSRPSA